MPPDSAALIDFTPEYAAAAFAACKKAGLSEKALSNGVLLKLIAAAKLGYGRLDAKGARCRNADWKVADQKAFEALHDALELTEAP